eukprot:CAMPEP_0118885152 /NCGR_PEP_ID=MMETSP1163-20130328/23738_1 /TAXON_ID=124430 /ORGANISM="Phaeomonas parva, Strain CCMP2877" /LENGTH=312 /DNA_ID=CAMNT_0006823105 /DNA_START=294 /DNA_END=1229 /DNA_ORIENTATION=+
MSRFYSPSRAPGGHADLSLPAFRRLCHQIRQQSKRTSGTASSEAVIEMLRQLGEFIVYGDRTSDGEGGEGEVGPADLPHRDIHFDVFCEGNTLGACVELANQASSSGAKIQLLQTLSILVQNVHSQTSLFFILSNNYVNQVLETILEDRTRDADLVDAFVAFCKTLALRINSRTIQFFFADQACTYCPLFEKCLVFLYAEDTMVRTSAMAVLLHFLQLAARGGEAPEADPAAVIAGAPPLQVPEMGTARFLNMKRNRRRVAAYLVHFLTTTHLRYLEAVHGAEGLRSMEVLDDLEEALLLVEDVLMTVRPPR